MRTAFLLGFFCLLFGAGSADWEVLEVLKVRYTEFGGGRTNSPTTIHISIKRQPTGDPESLQNNSKGKRVGQRGTNTDKDKLGLLKRMFMENEGSYKAPQGTIVGLDGGRWRIDQQDRDRTKHNIQFQVRFC